MNKIKTYEDFVNEEINLRKAAAGLALGAGLAFGSPAHSQTTTTQTQQSSKQEDKINGLGDLKWGMSVEDVKSKFPGCKKDINSIEVSNYKLNSDDYKATFTFNSDGLNNISLELKGGGVFGFDENFLKSKYKELISKLSLNYGSPYNVSRQKQQYKQWSKSDGNISIMVKDNKIFLNFESTSPTNNEISTPKKSEITTPSHQHSYVNAPMLDEKNGFRSFKFGMSIDTISNLKLIGRSGLSKLYQKTDDKLTIGDYEVKSIIYSFYKGNLDGIFIEISGYENSKGIFDIFVSKYGQGIKSNRYSEDYMWSGKNILMSYKENSISHDATIMMFTNIFDEQKSTDKKGLEERGKSDL